jgi:mono/diheme cytochrome c family protein
MRKIAVRLMWFAGYVMTPVLAISGALLLTGCSVASSSRRPPIEVWDDMDRQEKFKAQSSVGQDLYGVFSDRRSNRRPPEGTVARGKLVLEDAMNTGLVNASTYTGRNPVALTPEVLKLGEDKYEVYCTPCHDRAGTGQGIVNLREPTYKPGNLMDERIRAFADGQLYYTITNGKGNMNGYKYQLTVPERWAVVYYVRALQRAHTGTLADVPEEKKAALN